MPRLRGQRRWYGGAIVRGRRRLYDLQPRCARGGLRRHSALPVLGVTATSVLLAAGCGGTRQDAKEPTATYNVQVLRAAFPFKQSIARQTTMVLTVRNRGLRTVPNVAVTVDSFNYASNVPELAANKRPIWVIEQGPGPRASRPVESQEVSQPGGGQTAYVNTWALGPLPPRAIRTYAWVVVPVKPGLHTVHFRVQAGLSGKAKAQLASGLPAQGQFAVYVAPAPPTTYVDPNTGKVRVGTAPKLP
jgi:hypothetical protein